MTWEAITLDDEDDDDESDDDGDDDDDKNMRIYGVACVQL